MSLLKQHIINSLLDEQHSKKVKLHCIATVHLTSRQILKFKSPMIDTNHCLNKVFSSFNSLNKELSPSFHMMDNFSDHFSFYSVNQKTLILKSPIIANSIASLRILNWIITQYLLFMIPVSKTTSLLLSHTSVENKTSLPKPFII